MAQNRKKHGIAAVVVIGLLMVSIISVYAFSLGKYEKVKPTGNVVSIPVSKVNDGKAHFYKLTDNGKEITFFVVKAADGSLKTAFDACDACYRDKKGYEQLGDKMNCKNCNMKFAINRLGPNATGGCNPGYLPHRVNGATLSINVTDIKNGAKYF